MISFDETLDAIIAEEGEVEKLFRPRSPVTFDELPPVQPYLCVLKQERGSRVLVALHLKETRRNLIFDAGKGLAAGRTLDQALEQATGFTDALGATMEEVGLKYGKAMREVVLRDIPVLVPPGEAKKAAEEKEVARAEWQRLVDEQAAAERHPPDLSALTEKERSEALQAREQLEREAATAASRLAAEKRHRERTEAVRAAVEQKLLEIQGPEQFQLERRKLIEAREAEVKKVRELEKTVDRLSRQVEEFGRREEEQEQARSAAERRVGQLERELQRALQDNRAEQDRQSALKETQSEAERRLAELQTALETAEKEARRQTEESEALVAAQKKRIAEQMEARQAAEQKAEALAEELGQVRDRHDALREAGADQESEMRGRLHELEQALEQAQRSAATAEQTREELTVARDAAERRLAALEEQMRQTRSEADNARLSITERKDRCEELERILAEERERLAGEKALAEERWREAEKRLSRYRSEAEGTLKQRLADMENELQKSRERQTELATKKQQAADRLEEREKELQQLRQQVRTGSEAGAAEDGELKRRLAEAQQALRRAEDRSELLRSEIDRFAAGKAEAERRLAEVLATVGEGGVKPAADVCTFIPPASPVQAGTPKAPLPPGGPKPPDPDAFFNVDWEQEAIALGDPGELVELYQAMDMVQLSLEGFPTQYCSAYVVALQKGKHREVYVAFRLSTTGRNLIYVPRRHPTNRTSYGQAIREALKFLEVVGYLPERVSLGNGAGRGRKLDSIPVLGSVQRSAEGF